MHVCTVLQYDNSTLMPFDRPYGYVQYMYIKLEHHPEVVGFRNSRLMTAAIFKENKFKLFWDTGEVWDDLVNYFTKVSKGSGFCSMRYGSSKSFEVVSDKLHVYCSTVLRGVG